MKFLHFPPSQQFLFYFGFSLICCFVIFWLLYIFLPKHFRSNWRFRHKLLINLLLMLLLFATTTVYFYLTPKVVYPTDPALNSTMFSDKGPVVAEFNHFVNPKSLHYEISPQLPGSWKLSQSVWGGHESKLTFSPDISPDLSTRYTISVTGIRNALERDESKYLFSIETPDLPEISSVSFADGDKGILPNQVITATSDSTIPEIATFDFETTPVVDLSVERVGLVYSLTPKSPFKKGTQYNLKIYREINQINYKTGNKTQLSKDEIKNLNFETIDAPGLKKYSPTSDQVLTTDPIVLEFLQDMDKSSTEKAFSINPQVMGVFEWSDNRTMTFHPTLLSKETKYTVKLGTSALAADKSPLEEEISFDFTTIGAVVVSSTSPSSGGTKISVDQKISLTFNQAVNQASAESKFSITPAATGTFSWGGNTVSFAHSKLAYSTKYTVSIASGVVSISGINSRQPYTYSFTTADQSASLNVPAYHQAYMYSCMISAARSALAYRGISASESSIISKVGYDTTPWSGTWAEGGAIWGDPDVGIVGDLSGKADNIGWGYGSYWDPIAKALSSYGVSNEVKTNMTVSDLATQISAGNPIIIWWVNGAWPTYEVNWKTPAGKSIHGVNGMHVQVVKGFTGTVDNPTSFSVTDSGYGYPGKTYDIATFKAKWGWFSNTGIIVK
ncbi:MAG: Ig-like domain-containing protein [Candidatus Berkelbacteria bacterium]|nr:Ig-like domain-containing protein [Candidatus Berkelbacteria bacterium]